MSDDDIDDIYNNDEYYTESDEDEYQPNGMTFDENEGLTKEWDEGYASHYKTRVRFWFDRDQHSEQLVSMMHFAKRKAQELYYEQKKDESFREAKKTKQREQTAERVKKNRALQNMTGKRQPPIRQPVTRTCNKIDLATVASSIGYHSCRVKKHQLATKKNKVTEDTRQWVGNQSTVFDHVQMLEDSIQNYELEYNNDIPQIVHQFCQYLNIRTKNTRSIHKVLEKVAPVSGLHEKILSEYNNFAAQLKDGHYGIAVDGVLHVFRLTNDVFSRILYESKHITEENFESWQQSLHTGTTIDQYKPTFEIQYDKGFLFHIESLRGNTTKYRVYNINHMWVILCTIFWYFYGPPIPEDQKLCEEMKEFMKI